MNRHQQVEPPIDSRSNPAHVHYPVAAAVYPILALAAANAGEGIRATDLLLPLAISITVAVLSWLLANALTSDPHRRAFVSFVVVLWFAWYGQLMGIGERVATLGVLAEHQYAVPLSSVAGILLVAGVVRSRRSFGRVSRFLNIALTVLLAFPLLTLTTRGWTRQRWRPVVPLAGPASARPRSDLPDIYFIVLDAYTGGRSLKRNYQFDNAEFVSALQGRGFFVPRASRSNYTLTYLALAAALNWEYLEWLPALLGERSNDFAIPRAMIEDSRTQRFLKGLGYRVIFFPTAYGATARNRHADLLIPQGGQAHPRLRREFFSSWLRTTPLRPIFGWGCRLTRCRADPLPFNPESPELILWKFDQIGALARSPGPKFVFAHLLTPHEPYVFTANCTPKPLHWPSRMDRVEDRRIRVAYVEQIRCVNSNLLALVDRLQQQPLRPVIILQGDHGNGRFPFGRPQPLDVATPEQVAERADPFGAYYLPDGGNALLYDSISPVNVFPIVLRHYYGAQVQRLEDRTYYSSSRDPYRFTRIR